MTLILVSDLAMLGWRSGLPRPLRPASPPPCSGQYLLGVTTLLLVVPVPVAALHQSGAVLLLTVVLIVVHRLSGAPRPSGGSAGTGRDARDMPRPRLKVIFKGSSL